MSSYPFAIAKGGDKFYSKCSALIGYHGDISISKDEPEEELKKKEAFLKARNEVSNLYSLHGGWVYEISSAKGTLMIKNGKTLLMRFPIRVFT